VQLPLKLIFSPNTSCLGRASTGKAVSPSCNQRSGGREIRQFRRFQFVKTNPPRLGGNVLFSGPAKDLLCVGLIIYKCVSAANYRTLGEIARISGTAKIAKSRNQRFFSLRNAKLQKLLAFVVYSCYKTTSPSHWRASFLGHLQPCCS
jgi:hypothetical protein